MKRDIAIKIDDIILNIRVGIIFKYNNKVIVEVPKNNMYNSVVPGGRLKVGEYRIDALKREIKEEMNFNLLDKKIKYRDTIESFFEFDNQNFHELFFVYEYLVDENDYEELLKIKENQDNHRTTYEFISYDQFDEYNLLPMEVRDIIKE